MEPRGRNSSPFEMWNGALYDLSLQCLRDTWLPYLCFHLRVPYHYIISLPTTSSLFSSLSLSHLSTLHFRVLPQLYFHKMYHLQSNHQYISLAPYEIGRGLDIQVESNSVHTIISNSLNHSFIQS